MVKKSKLTLQPRHRARFLGQCARRAPRLHAAVVQPVARDAVLAASPDSKAGPEAALLAANAAGALLQGVGCLGAACALATVLAPAAHGDGANDARPGGGAGMA